jgi:glycosyltransferase involved in cell wall biosynthesis
MFISICIPTYNEPDKIKTLLVSISAQTYKDYEIIITDDSTNDQTKNIVHDGVEHLPLTYIKNDLAKGTPENWNFAISLAKGKWIKLMHHDDWFTNENALGEFAKQAATAGDKCNFIFSAYQNVYLGKDKTELVLAGAVKRFFVKRMPLLLFKENIIGNPSCTLVRNDPSMLLRYDNHLKWIVDFEYYITLINAGVVFCYLPKPLISVGIHDTQVTAGVQLNPAVEIPEAMYFLQKHGLPVLKNIFAFDYFWRLIRNLGITDMENFNSYLKQPCNYKVMYSIIRLQKSVKPSLLKIGVVSKCLMTISYIKNIFRVTGSE